MTPTRRRRPGKDLRAATTSPGRAKSKKNAGSKVGPNPWENAPPGRCEDAAAKPSRPRRVENAGTAVKRTAAAVTTQLGGLQDNGHKYHGAWRENAVSHSSAISVHPPVNHI